MTLQNVEKIKGATDQKRAKTLRANKALVIIINCS